MNIALAISKFALRLKEKGVDEPELNAIYIICDTFNLKRNDLILERDREIDKKKLSEIIKKIRLKEKGFPLSWIIGKHNFCGIDISIDKGVFVPRPETEELAVEVNKYISYLTQKKKIKVLDFCAGSGCISIFLAIKNPDVYFYAVEKSQKAINCIAKNVEKFQIKNLKYFRNDNILFLKEKFDILVSNPPYIPSHIIPSLDIEVLKEPKLALDGGKDGLDVIRTIERDGKKVLKRNGVLFLEFGDNQAEKILEIFSNWKEVTLIKDINGKFRFLKAVKNG